MVSVQEYLNKEYPKDKRDSVKDLRINSNSLTGSLDLSDFINLEELRCYNNQLTNLILPNSKLTYIDCDRNNFSNLTINNQGYLKMFRCINNKLLTSLTITNNPSLTTIYCQDCKLTTLNLTNNINLQILSCQNNQLSTKLNFLTKLTSESLTYLSINDNNLISGDLANFSQFTKLKNLYLKDNPFLIGSLQPLQNLISLEILGIENTNFDQGLEYLSEKLNWIHCSNNKLVEQLKNYKGTSVNQYNYQEWRKDNPSLTGKTEKTGVGVPITKTQWDNDYSQRPTKADYDALLEKLKNTVPITKEEHEKLVANQKPSDLPTDWKKQITFLNDGAKLLGYIDGYKKENDEEMRDKLRKGKNLTDELEKLTSPTPQTTPPTIPTAQEMYEKIVEWKNNQEDPNHYDYDDIKSKLKNWVDKFPSPLNSFKVNLVYKQGLIDLEWPKKFPKPLTPNKVKAKVDELTTWTNAFLEEEFTDDDGNKLTPAQIKTKYDKNATELTDWKTNFSVEIAKPMTVAEIKAEYDKPKSTPLTTEQKKAIAEYPKWTAAFPTTTFGTKTPSQIKTDYDTIKNSLTNWTNAFPPSEFKDDKNNVLTPAQIKVKYDELKDKDSAWIVAFPKKDFEEKTPTPITPANVRTVYNDYGNIKVLFVKKEIENIVRRVEELMTNLYTPGNPEPTLEITKVDLNGVNGYNEDYETKLSTELTYNKKDDALKFEAAITELIIKLSIKKISSKYDATKPFDTYSTDDKMRISAAFQKVLIEVEWYVRWTLDYKKTDNPFYNVRHEISTSGVNNEKDKISGDNTTWWGRLSRVREQTSSAVQFYGEKKAFEAKVEVPPKP